MIENVQVARATIAQVLSIHLVFKPYGWATFYVDDARGTLALVSDWGEYAHRWGRGSHLGVEPHDLSLALRGHIGSDPDYIARKLFLGRELERYDPELTKREWRRMICEQRRYGSVSREDARRAWDQIRQVDFHANPESIWPDVPRPLRRIIGDPCEAFFKSETARFLTVRDVLLPAFIAELRRLVQPSTEAAEVQR